MLRQISKNIVGTSFFTNFAKITLIVPELKTKAFFLLFFLLSAVISTSGQELSEELRGDVVFLSDPSMKGRGLGEAGGQNAVFHIFKTFSEAGLWTRVQSFEADGKLGHNVIGFTPGYYKDWIVVGAYFDGLGTVDDKSYPGADSNASGVAALMALARRWPRDTKGTGIIYVAFDGHNANMSGSEAFLKMAERVYPISMMANIDIIGSTQVPVKEDRPDYLIILGDYGINFQMYKANIGINLQLNYDYYGSTRFTDLFYKSMCDQKWFVAKRIPAVLFTSGITMDTNKMTDTPDKLDYDIMARRVQLIGRWLKSML